VTPSRRGVRAAEPPRVDRLFVSDVAATVGVTHSTIRQHIRRGTMPVPDGYVGRRRWWSRPTIEAWMKTRRKPGNPNFQRAPRTSTLS
jgi:predicted DNA-binding transcriptional regulator AlpA